MATTAATYGYGIGGTDDLPLRFTLVGGTENVANCIARRLITTRGSMPWAPDAGLDLRSYVNGTLTGPQLAALQGAISAECEKDERVQSCETTVQGGFSDGRIVVRLYLTLETGPFELVLSISSLTVEILETVTQ